MTSIIAINVKREDVESTNTSLIVRLLDTYATNAETALAHLGKVTLSMSGFDDDPRSLWDIPQARSWWAALNREVPHLLFYVFQDRNGPHFIALMSCPLVEHNGNRGFTIDEGQRFMEESFAAMNKFCENVGIDPTCDAFMNHCMTLGESIVGPAM